MSGSGKPEERAEEHHPDLAGVRGEGVANEPADVVVDPPPFTDGGDDGGEVVVGEHHVGRLLGHLGAGDAHRDADVGVRKRRGVVDTVAGHGDDVAVRLPGLDDVELLLRARSGRRPPRS